MIFEICMWFFLFIIVTVVVILYICIGLFVIAAFLNVVFCISICYICSMIYDNLIYKYYYKLNTIYLKYDKLLEYKERKYYILFLRFFGIKRKKVPLKRLAVVVIEKQRKYW